MDLTRHATFFDLGDVPWDERLAFVVETMREMSRQSEPQKLVQAYGARMRKVLRSDRFLSLSRRDLTPPQYRITRSSTWDNAPNPWQEREKLPVFDRGLLGKLIYGDEPVIIDDLQLAADEPAAAFFEGMRSLVAVPLYDQGVAMNMVVVMRREANSFRHEGLPEHVWMSNLFGRATHNLVLSEEVKRAYEAVDRELQIVADIQRSLLPVDLPRIPTLDIAVHYQTSKRAGGDYYDFFPLPDGRWGILIADVSGHGTPAAVIMAVTHSIAHTHHGPPNPPGRLLNFINAHLTARYTGGSGTFVTAFYGIYDPKDRSLTYACAGHCPPRVKGADGSLRSMDREGDAPLGIDADTVYNDTTETFQPGDAVVFYTDGITEARGPDAELFGLQRLDDALRDCCDSASDAVTGVLSAVEQFTGGRPANDDRTLLVLKVS